MGAFVTAAGDPGSYGEWISLSNRCMPPVGRPSTLKVGTLGVGTGAAMLGFRAPNEKVVLIGVPTEPPSEPSGLDIDRVRCFKLREDLFFLMPAAGPFPFLGEAGTRVLSLDMAWLSAGVAGEIVKLVSAGLGAAGCGDEVAKLVMRGKVGILNAGSY